MLLKTRARLALAATLALAAPAFAIDSTKMMIPANPGGGWDTTGRELGKAMQAAGAVKNVQYDNKGGAAGTIGLAQFVNSAKGDPSATMMTGLVMVGGIVMNKSPVNLSQTTPLARLMSEYEVIVVPGNSPYKTLKDLVDAFKANPGSISWGGGSAGGVDHILAISSEKRLAGINIPTLKEQGFDVVLANWRGIVGPPGITKAQRDELIKALDVTVKSKGWQETLKKQEWDDYYLAGDAFNAFIDSEMKRLGTVLGDLSLGGK